MALSANLVIWRSGFKRGLKGGIIIVELTQSVAGPDGREVRKDLEYVWEVWGEMGGNERKNGRQYQHTTGENQHIMADL